MTAVRATLLSACVLLSTGGAAHAQTRPLPDVAQPGAPVPTSPLFPSSTVGDLLTRHLNLMVSVGEEVESRYQESLRLIQKEPEAVRLLQDAYSKTVETEYFLRWQLVYTLASLNQRDALSGLVRIAVSTIPAERGSAEFFTTGQESNIRVAAVDGLASLAKLGVTEAGSYLLRLSQHSDLSIRQRAVRGYLAAGPDYDARVKLLQANLPTSDHGLITLRVTEVRGVAHPDDTPEDMRPRTRERDDESPIAR
ncbi:hypothetical protein D187_002447 [Cystobacter fuscus DSM 2262]|uniref:HEAT repeat domain-containing protein n=1 Tax=Cystobacter fuscus (strain ATCC 25194 / DSM 2262 / NBRC 100088 / M29) TaxID=1242864 RepID=S9QST6_CYSF2|nr:hypothetical protein [Cystobacter fuscus]EPX59703.1 hypothetical protein D187_002447 [Cystobacter fuscus DSM 2262]